MNDNLIRTCRASLMAATVLTAMSTAAHAEGYDSRSVVTDRNGGVVLNTFGNCVRTSWVEGDDACAPEAPPQVAQRVETPIRPTTEERKIYFDFDSSDLDADARARLDNLSRQLQSSDVRGARIMGFADQIGTTEYNQALSQRRAQAVQGYLGQRGFNTQTAEVSALGESRKTTACDDVKERALLIDCLRPDRRVEVQIDYYDPSQGVTNTPR